MSSYTRVPAVIDAKVGGKFKLFDGSIEGEFTELKPYSKIVEKWRFKEWPEDHYSIVQIDLTAPTDSTCRLSLHQTGVPLRDRYGNGDVPAKVRQGWEQFFWDRIRKVLGFSKTSLDDDDDD